MDMTGRLDEPKSSASDSSSPRSHFETPRGGTREAAEENKPLWATLKLKKTGRLETLNSVKEVDNIKVPTNNHLAPVVRLLKTSSDIPVEDNAPSFVSPADARSLWGQRDKELQVKQRKEILRSKSSIRDRSQQRKASEVEE
eukprot:GHVP01005607.1.p1 GENE.GHVP01005607.1~~GHVP01005607.1.p1  ORF type:complete len:142 (-),score=32.90 GHVP01005607.1:166-591(-)